VTGFALPGAFAGLAARPAGVFAFLAICLRWSVRRGSVATRQWRIVWRELDRKRSLAGEDLGQRPVAPSAGVNLYQQARRTGRQRDRDRGHRLQGVR
jgi:hypothetical protein